MRIDPTVFRAAVRPSEIPKSDSHGAAMVNITPWSGYVDEWKEPSYRGADFSGMYTRLMIHGEMASRGGQDDGTEVLPYEPRGWVARAFVDRDFSMNLSAHVTAGNFVATVPLATISHESGSKGESWSRSIHHSRSGFPLFLVSVDGRSSAPSVKISVNGSKSYTSRGAATAMQVAVGISDAVSHNLPVITRLTQSVAKEQAIALDDAISRLFASGLTEEHWSDRDLKEWRVGEEGEPRGVHVRFFIPKDYSWNSKEPRYVGSWILTFDYPRPSVFSDWRVCPEQNQLKRCVTDKVQAQHNAMTSFSAGEILNYPVLVGGQETGSVHALLSQKAWFTASQVAMANRNKADAAGSNFCRLIVNEITGLGLNEFDARAVVWAVAKGMPMADAAISLDKATGCRAIIAEIDAVRGR
ncbi:hypothetical protein [Arenimonas daejeonensis]|uniref:hypothetical protein n=1 Tax=Arenimonas daejeonensis TaxID=370777 RepID=UPI0011BE02FE|nr:hypothetical protein [Arenimonas daejeonensis]